MKKLFLPLLSSALLLAACGGGGSPQPAADIAAPAVTLSATQSGKVVNLSAAAADNVGVSKVEFYRGGTLINTDVASPYAFADTVSTANNGNVTYTAKAYDAAGNVGQDSKTIVVNITTPTSTAYQGQYYWALFTDPNDLEGSLLAEGAAIFDEEFIGVDGQMLGAGAYAKLNPLPQVQGEAIIGDITVEGQVVLSSAFFYDTEDTESYLVAIDNDGKFSPTQDGNPIFIGEAATFGLDGKVISEGYFGLLRTNEDPNAVNSLSGSKRGIAKAELLTALKSPGQLNRTLKVTGVKREITQLNRLKR